MEKWKQIEEFPKYELSSKGRIRNKLGHILKPRLNMVTDAGYYFLVNAGSRKKCGIGIAKLMAKYWPTHKGPFGPKWYKETCRSIAPTRPLSSYAPPAPMPTANEQKTPPVSLDWWKQIDYTPGCPDGPVSPMYMPLDYKEFGHVGEYISARRCVISSGDWSWIVHLHDMVPFGCYPAAML